MTKGGLHSSRFRGGPNGIEAAFLNLDPAIPISRPRSDKPTILQKLCEAPLRMIAATWLFEETSIPNHPDNLRPNMLMSQSADGQADLSELPNADTATKCVIVGRLFPVTLTFFVPLLVPTMVFACCQI